MLLMSLGDRPRLALLRVTPDQACSAGRTWAPDSKTMTLNCGGITAELYDTTSSVTGYRLKLHAMWWFYRRFIGVLGRQDSIWSISGWSFLVTADPDNRFCGVAMAISNPVALPHQITYCSWIPGRLLHSTSNVNSSRLLWIC